MNKKLYVGNLSYDCTQEDLEGLFTQFGKVEEVHLARDKATGRARGFGFITMQDDESAQKAMQDLHDTEFLGRKLMVKEAFREEDKPARQNNRFAGKGGGRSFGGGNRGGGRGRF